MKLLSGERPRFSKEDAIRIARDFFGFGATSVDELPSERDQNFLLAGAMGERRVLKIARASEDAAVLDLQNAALSHLAETCSEYAFPKVLLSVDGQQIVRVGDHGVRLLSYVPGRVLARVTPHSDALLVSLGRLLGVMDRALGSFRHPAARREFHWDLTRAGAVIVPRLAEIDDGERRALVERALSRFEVDVAPRLASLRRSVIHNDANDHNVLVDARGSWDEGTRSLAATSLIDFGDMLETASVSEVAIGATYALSGKTNPLSAAASVVNGYHRVFPLREDELELLYDLILTRLSMSVTLAAHQRKEDPENAYLSISEESAWESLGRWSAVHPRWARYVFRSACGLEPSPHARDVTAWLRAQKGSFGKVLEEGLDQVAVLDLSVVSPDVNPLAPEASVEVFTKRIFDEMASRGAKVGVGRYDEARLVYASPLFQTDGEAPGGARTIHLGIDLFVPAGTPVRAPLTGVIHSLRNNAAPLDYGPTIVLEHASPAGPFYTLYGHLSEDSLDGLRAGREIPREGLVGRVGSPPANGGWPPHVHFQVVTDLLSSEGDFPGVALPGERALRLHLCPDPNLLLGIREDLLARPRTGEEILALRRRHIGPSLSLSYLTPLTFVRGFMQNLYDDAGRKYLDAINNVPHVGHSHPRVVKAVAAQMTVLNTNTRYLHDNLVRYAERLTSKLPPPLRVCFFVNSGSEANDLALRLARTHTRRKNVVVLEGAYHGNLTSLIEISPYKFDGPGGSGAPPHVHKVRIPDVFRGAYRAAEPLAGSKYAQDAREVLERHGPDVAAFIAESLPSSAGQIVLPGGYLTEAYRLVRAAGGVCIADEVQVGFGRVGTHFCGFETQDVVPDIVTFGKPIGNGHPLGAVVTTREIAESFANGMEYFNTFGGNPVSCAAGLAVLDVLEEEGLQAHALRVGGEMKAGLEALREKHALVGDVRGMGFFLGVELVRDRDTLGPAGAEASYVAERLKEEGILIGTEGPGHNVLKIRPPLVFAERDAERLVATLDRVLAEDCLR